MNLFYLKLFCVLLLISISAAAQQLNFYGQAKPGSVIIGKADNLKSVTLNKKNVMFDDNGFFIFGFDRDAKGTHVLKIRFTKGKTFTKKFLLPKRKYEIQRLRVSGKYVKPPQDELDRIFDEAAQMKSARKQIGNIDSAYFSTGFIQPVDSPRITGVFGSQRILNGIKKKPHNGTDYGASEGTPVYSLSDGIVIIAGNDFFYNGSFVLITHGQGLSSVYLHMNKIFVNTGDKVIKGQKIGEVGSTGRSTAAHLHLGVQWFNKRIDPLSLFEINLK